MEREREKVHVCIITEICYHMIECMYVCNIIEVCYHVEVFSYFQLQQHGPRQLSVESVHQVPLLLG